VALARAIVVHPSVLLMDEPLSNLDAKLRVEMRGAIRDIQKKVGITTVYVTHDQEEALCISDRIAVMKEGVIQQIGAPQAIYARPANTFVATFIGHSNLFKATLAGGALRFTPDTLATWETILPDSAGRKPRPGSGRGAPRGIPPVRFGRGNGLHAS
jgi:ABC-type Fe3+/spermidine/putrescine transport system ATPase subunit